MFPAFCISSFSCGGVVSIKSFSIYGVAVEAVCSRAALAEIEFPSASGRMVIVPWNRSRIRFAMCS